MTSLHHIRVRRARRLPMPLPPKPKRPLGPAVLLYWGDVPIRVRADIEKGGRTWDEFLDAMADLDASDLTSGDFRLAGRGHRAVAALVPPSQRAATIKDFFGRVRAIHAKRNERQEAQWQAIVEAREARRSVPPHLARSIIGRIFGRSA